MATCNPNSLTAAATCFRCVPHREKRTLDLYLLNSAAGSFTIAQLATGAAQFRPIQDKAALAAKCYALAVANGLTATGSVLEGLAKCWQCIPKSERENVEAYLNASNLGGSTDPKVLLRNIATYKGLFPVAEQVELYLLSSVANLTRAQLMAGAACLMCLSITRLQEVYLYLLCLGINANIIPGGSTYSGATPEFDLNVIANTNYIITWGANELSMTLCGTSIANMGAGTQVVVNTGACTLMQFFGTFAGTTVTAKVQKIPAAGVLVAPTGFTWSFDINTTLATASWTAPAAGVFSTELWTSTDGTNYTLAATQLNNGTTSVSVATAAGILYGEIRHTSKAFPGYSAFTAAQSVIVPGAQAISDANTWSALVVTNGGAAPSVATVTAVKMFAQRLINASIRTKMLAVSFFPPDNLIACLTPIYGSIGASAWSNQGGGFVAGDLSVNGLTGAGARNPQTCIKPQILGTQIPSPNAWGYTVYVKTVGVRNVYDFGYTNDAASDAALSAHAVVAGNATYSHGFWDASGGGRMSALLGAGYYSTNRDSATSIKLFYATSAVAHAQINSYGGAASVPSAHDFFIFMANHWNSGNPQDIGATDNTLSFFAIHQNLTLAESALFFAAVQKLRQDFGGGYV